MCVGIFDDEWGDVAVARVKRRVSAKDSFVIHAGCARGRKSGSDQEGFGGVGQRVPRKVKGKIEALRGVLGEVEGGSSALAPLGEDAADIAEFVSSARDQRDRERQTSEFFVL